MINRGRFKMSGKVLKHIEFVFENCDTLVVTEDLVYSFHLDIIKDCLYTGTTWRNHGSPTVESDLVLNEKIIVDDVFIVLEPTARNLFGRFVHYNDIVTIELHFDDGDVICYEPVWIDATVGGEENALQKSFLLEDDGLAICISEKNMGVLTQNLKIKEGC